ncbi:MAG TPA: hypothetical protein VIJ14_04350, partial [Rhabdochlamydiaceae bacterium]
LSSRLGRRPFKKGFYKAISYLTLRVKICNSQWPKKADFLTFAIVGKDAHEEGFGLRSVVRLNWMSTVFEIVWQNSILIFNYKH